MLYCAAVGPRVGALIKKERSHVYLRNKVLVVLRFLLAREELRATRHHKATFNINVVGKSHGQSSRRQNAKHINHTNGQVVGRLT